MKKDNAEEMEESDCKLHMIHSLPPSFLIFPGMPNRRKRACIQQCHFEHKCGHDKPAFLAHQTIAARRHGEMR